MQPKIAIVSIQWISQTSVCDVNCLDNNRSRRLSMLGLIADGFLTPFEGTRAAKVTRSSVGLDERFDRFDRSADRPAGVETEVFKEPH